MSRMPKLYLAQRWVLCLTLALSSILLLQGLSVKAAPPAGPRLGITPTPTLTHAPRPTSTPVAEHADPVIVKWGEPEEALPGEEVTFHIQATNKGKKATVDVVVTDVIPEYLEILQVTTTQGTFTIEGQKVTINMGIIGPGFVVEATIRTRVREDAPAPLEMENLALLRSPNGGERTSSPVIISIPAPGLPRTGRPKAPWLVSAIVGSGLAMLAVYLWRNRSARRAL
jgi:uncharacterized repeat protein (TIGR01451 family)